jgi:hypothetical protein
MFKKVKILKKQKINHLNNRLKTKANLFLPKNHKQHKKLLKPTNKPNNQTTKKVPKIKAHCPKIKALLNKLNSKKTLMTI